MSLQFDFRDVVLGYAERPADGVLPCRVEHRKYTIFRVVRQHGEELRKVVELNDVALLRLGERGRRDHREVVAVGAVVDERLGVRVLEVAHPARLQLVERVFRNGTELLVKNALLLLVLVAVVRLLGAFRAVFAPLLEVIELVAELRKRLVHREIEGLQYGVVARNGRNRHLLRVLAEQKPQPAVALRFPHSVEKVV